MMSYGYRNNPKSVAVCSGVNNKCTCTGFRPMYPELYMAHLNGITNEQAQVLGVQD